MRPPITAMAIGARASPPAQRVHFPTRPVPCTGAGLARGGRSADARRGAVHPQTPAPQARPRGGAAVTPPGGPAAPTWAAFTPSTHHQPASFVECLADG